MAGISEHGGVAVDGIHLPEDARRISLRHADDTVPTNAASLPVDNVDPQPAADVVVPGVAYVHPSVIDIAGDESEGNAGTDHKPLRKGKRKETTQMVSVLTLFSFADPLDRLLMFLGTIGAIGAGVSQPAMTLLLGSLINAFGQNSSNTKHLVHEVSNIALIYVYIGLGAALTSYLEVACWTVTGERQAARIRGNYLKAILRQDVTFFDKETTSGEVIGRMSGDTVLIQEALGDKVGNFVQLCARFVGGFVIAFARGWKLTLILISIIPLLIAGGGVLTMRLSKLVSVSQNAYADAATIAEQVLSAIRTVAAYTGEKKAVVDYDVGLKKAESTGWHQGMATGLGFGFILFVMFCSYALAIWYGSKMVANGNLTGGQVINVVFAVIQGGMSLGQMPPPLTAFASGRAAAFKMFEVIHAKPAIDVTDMSGIILDKVKGSIELRNVDFSYPTRPKVKVFSEFSLAIESGTTVALVGESGSGKSTVVSLIERFYDPQVGEVLVDGIDIRTMQLKWLRHQIGLVSQEPVLFGTSIMENIAYGKDGSTIEEIQAASDLANASVFIKKLPEGFETQVGERGIQLSGGQKQRVAIARAILKNPRILLLDEATSALDTASEQVVQEALDKVMVGRTTVVVAHRLTTITYADVIAVVQRGVIIETGTHSELIKKPDGAYSQLIHLQQMHTTESPWDAAHTDNEIIPQDEKQLLARGGSSRRSGSSKGGSSRFSFTLNKSLSRSNSLIIPIRLDDIEMNVGRKTQDVSVLRLAAINKPEAPLLVIGTFAAIGNGLIFPTFGLLLSSAIYSFFQTPHKIRTDGKFWALMFFLLGLSNLVVNPIQKTCFAVAGNKLIRRVRKLTFEKVLRQEISWFDDEANSSGAISARLSTDAAAVKAMVGDALSLLVQNMATIVAALVIAFTANWELALLVVAIVPLMAAQSMLHVKRMKGFAVDAKLNYEEASKVANDAVSNIRTVASFCAEEKVLKLYDEQCKSPVKSGIRQGLISGSSVSLSNLLLFCSYALSFWAGGKLVEAGDTTFKHVFRVFFALSMSAIGFTQSVSLAPDFSKTRAATNSIFTILDRNSKIDPTDTSGTVLTNLKGQIEFRHVYFKYPSRPDVPILLGMSFVVKPGETMALVGESGSGKSTVVSLLERFYDPEGGVILVDGVDIKRLQLTWLRQNIGLVSQEPVLFDGSILGNIGYGREAITSQEEVEAAAKAANAHNFICSLPDGYNTRVGERGIQLSGGQKQRIAIARAIIKNPKILLLDEATSALDAESEHAVQEALDNIMVQRSTIVIAHRLSTVRHASVIAVVKNGIIVETGSHDTLIVSGGAYASLVKFNSAVS